MCFLSGKTGGEGLTDLPAMHGFPTDSWPLAQHICQLHRRHTLFSKASHLGCCAHSAASHVGQVYGLSVC